MIRYRLAHLADIPAAMAIRNSVRENALVSVKLRAVDYDRAFTLEGRAWVAEDDGEVVGFVCGRPEKKDIWALFVRESHHRRGIGDALMALVEPWMFSEGVDVISLSTAPGTRAERLYERRGWERFEIGSEVEVGFRLRRSA